MASKENPIRKIFDARPMEGPIEGTKKKFGRCVIEKSEKAAMLDFRKIFTLIAEQIIYILIDLIGSLKSNISWFLSDPIYLQNLHVYHVFDENDFIEKM